MSETETEQSETGQTDRGRPCCIDFAAVVPALDKLADYRNTGQCSDLVGDILDNGKPFSDFLLFKWCPNKEVILCVARPGPRFEAILVACEARINGTGDPMHA